MAATETCLEVRMGGTTALYTTSLHGHTHPYLRLETGALQTASRNFSFPAPPASLTYGMWRNSSHIRTASNNPSTGRSRPCQTFGRLTTYLFQKGMHDSLSFEGHVQHPAGLRTDITAGIHADIQAAAFLGHTTCMMK